MGESEYQQHDKDERRSGDGPFRMETYSKRRPEYRMREPHLGRKAKDQRAEQSCGATGVDENQTATRAVSREGADQSRQRRGIEQCPIDHDSGGGIAAQPDIDLGRPQAEYEDRQAA